MSYQPDKIYEVAVIGGGSGGIMATLRSVLNNNETILFPGSPKHKKKSRAMWVAKVENMPAHFHYKKGIEEPNRDTLKWIANSEFKNNLFLKKNLGVEKLSKNEMGFFEMTASDGLVYRSKYVILATGVMDVQPHIGGTIDPVFPYANAQIIDYCLRCDGHHVLGKKTAIIGHSNVAAWVSVMLFERYQTPSMTIFTHGEQPQFGEEVQKLIKLYGIQTRVSKIVEIEGETKQRPPILKAFKLEDGSRHEVDFSFVSLGMIVYNDLAKMVQAELDDRGFVVTNQKGESSVGNLFVVGDLRAGVKKQIYTAWDTAVDSADEINSRIRRHNREVKLNT